MATKKKGTSKFGAPTKPFPRKVKGDSKKGSGAHPVSHSRDPLGWSRNRTPKPSRDPLGHARRGS